MSPIWRRGSREACSCQWLAIAVARATALAAATSAELFNEFRPPRDTGPNVEACIRICECRPLHKLVREALSQTRTSRPYVSVSHSCSSPSSEKEELKATRCPSFSVSTRTPSQSNSSALGKALDAKHRARRRLETECRGNREAKEGDLTEHVPNLENMVRAGALRYGARLPALRTPRCSTAQATCTAC
jgi:hypothetical protein